MSTRSTPVLLPMPRRLTMLEGELSLPSGGRANLIHDITTDLLPAREVIGQALADCDCLLIHGNSDGQPRVELAIDSAIGHAEGYHLTIEPAVIRLTAADPAGAFYGAQTLRQLLRQSSGSLPCLRIEDWPDYPARGVMLDISRDKVPTMATLMELIDLLAEWKVNQLQLYTEHTFAYRDHAVVWQDASPLTAAEVQALDAYCRRHFIELVPNQNSFGHMERWLKHDRYRDLAECPDGAFYWDQHRPPATLNPQDPRSLELVRQLHAELLPNFTSRKFNVGCDETMELGMGRSKSLAETVGRERVYLDFLLKIHAGVAGHGRQMQFWGDIILHKPELIPELPKDVVALEWGYEADHKFEERLPKFADSGIPFYVCPGTSSWLSLAGRTDNAITNLHRAADIGLQHGAIGYLNTDWGDHGHLQYLPASLIPFACGAAVSWCRQTNPAERLLDQASLHAFRDASGQAARAFWDLGNVYQTIGRRRSNGSWLFFLLLFEPKPQQVEQVTLQNVEQTEAAIDAAMHMLDSAHICRPDSTLIEDEFRNTTAMLKHACRRAAWMLDPAMASPADLRDELEGLIKSHRRLWLARNRPGGLTDSVGRLERLRNDYAAS